MPRAPVRSDTSDRSARGARDVPGAGPRSAHEAPSDAQPTRLGALLGASPGVSRRLALANDGGRLVVRGVQPSERWHGGASPRWERRATEAPRGLMWVGPRGRTAALT